VQCENNPEFEVVVVMGTKSTKALAAQKREQGKKLKSLHANDLERDGYENNSNDEDDTRDSQKPSESSSNDESDPQEPTPPTPELDDAYDLAIEQLMKEMKHAPQAQRTGMSQHDKCKHEHRRPVARTNPKGGVPVTRGDLERVPRCKQSEGTTYKPKMSQKEGVQLDADLLKSQVHDKRNSRKWQESFLSDEQRKAIFKQRKANYQASDAAHDSAQVRPLPKELETSWEECNTEYWSNGRDITSKVLGGLSMPVFYLLIHTKRERVVTRLTGAIGEPR
jgi:hypothetical protein